MDVNVARAIANVQSRLKRIEDTLAGAIQPDEDRSLRTFLPSELKHAVFSAYLLMLLNSCMLCYSGSGVDFEQIGLPVESLSENQMLAAMYGTEGYRMSQFCLGTWPNENFTNQSVVVSGAQRAGTDDEPNEYYRVKVKKTKQPKHPPLKCSTTIHLPSMHRLSPN